MSDYRKNLNQQLPATMSERDFQRFAALVYENSGIKLPPAKKIMLEARLQKRLKALGISSFEKYGDYVMGPEGRENELVHMIDVVTTNKTDFFREPAHFDFMVKTALPKIMHARKESGHEPVRVWSAGCSSGEEPYTLAMVLSEYSHNNPGFRFTILASDISTKILSTAKSAIYAEERVDTIPLDLKKNIC